MDKITLWKDRDKGTIDPELFSVKAKELAKRLAEDNKNSKGEKANRRT
ncbi:MAG TPA: type III-A CRISPR-associated protein Csm2, partial [Desulfobacterales bacterium]|nr:type III-A CRISPR-associated protein Csm2 [Desulfobacterales bacterium]